MTFDWALWVSLFVLSLLESFTYYLVKSYYLLPNDNKNYGLLVGACILYGSIPLVILFVFNYSKTDSVGWFNALWNVFSTVYILVQGWLIFNEGISTMAWVGIAVAIVGMILMNWDSTIGQWV